MREIKFRFWSTKHGSWVGWEISGWINVGDKEKKIVTLHPKPLDEAVVMQYTGLKDKNDKEIYEGDILDISKGEVGSLINKYFYVEYIIENLGHTPASFYLCLHSEGKSLPSLNLAHAYKYEVIGNIYENPELLQGGGTNV